ncbi:hypothetical protein Skr01_48760 [Sphaerisporangium krabiense]|nr:hypothetical protein Skr01_48760 [Sphaerisporangium krabiense]
MCEAMTLHTENPPHRTAVALRLALTVLLAGVLGAVASAPPDAYAMTSDGVGSAAATGDGRNGIARSRIGNGSYNKIYAGQNPTTMRGVQQVSNTIVNGNSPTQVAKCVKRRVCVIRQKLWHRW